MTINELIFSAKTKIKDIKKEHKILVGFQKENPHLIDALLNEMRLRVKKSGSSLPTLDSLLVFEKDFIVDSLSKVYRQLEKNKDPQCMICFYKVVPEFYAEQRNKGYSLGEVDDLGYIVTGSNLVIETSTVQREEFLLHYFGVNN